jgi:cbb3-type cytochrome oxidase maturation protein
MTDFFYLIPIALALGAIGLGAFMWSLRSGQYEDLDGAAERILFDEDAPATGARRNRSTSSASKPGGTLDGEISVAHGEDVAAPATR